MSRERRYSIRREPEASWTLVFDVTENAWLVEHWPRDPQTQTARPEDRRRIPLPEFEATDMGKALAAQIQAAIARAVQDL